MVIVMSVIMLILVAAGTIGMLVGYIWMLVAAFRVSFGWFLGVLLIGIIGIPLFLLFHWEDAKRPLITIVLSVVAGAAAGAISDRLDRIEKLRQEREAIMRE
jgi:hypothetical protein